MNLTTTISSLPVLKDEVNKLLAKHMGDYDKLPPLVNNDQPLQVILSRISIFCKAFEKTVHGDLNKDDTPESSDVRYI